MKGIQKKIVQKRMFWPDAVRTISVFLVIIIHVSATTVLSWGEIGHWQWMIANVFDSVARISVPLFIILSGSLLIHKKDNLKTFFKKRLNRIMFPWFFWGIVLLLFEGFKFGEKSIKLILLENFFGGFWFMPMIVGIYLIAPIIKKFVVNATKNEIKYFFTIWFLIASLFPTIKNIFDININFNTPIWLLYSGYFVGGYYITKKLKITRKLIQQTKIIFIINLITTIIGTYQLSLEKNIFSGYLYEFVSLNIVLMSFSSFIILFNFFKKNKFGKIFKKYITSWSKNSFGILLSHIIILRILESIILKIGLSFDQNFSWAFLLLVIPTLAIITFLISNKLVLELKKIKFLEKFVG